MAGDQPGIIGEIKCSSHTCRIPEKGDFVSFPSMYLTVTCPAESDRRNGTWPRTGGERGAPYRPLITFRHF